MKKILFALCTSLVLMASTASAYEIDEGYYVVVNQNVTTASCEERVRAIVNETGGNITKVLANLRVIQGVLTKVSALSVALLPCVKDVLSIKGKSKIVVVNDAAKFLEELQSKPLCGTLKRESPSNSMVLQNFLLVSDTQNVIYKLEFTAANQEVSHFLANAMNGSLICIDEGNTVKNKVLVNQISADTAALPRVSRSN